jgi:hypothetical protein
MYLISKIVQLFFRVALFHGQEFLTDVVESTRHEMEKITKEINLYLLINQAINFNLKIKDLPRCCKLCICLCYSTRKKRDVNSLAWISFNLFDYEGFMLNGARNVFMWKTDSKSSFLYLCQTHVTGPNPEKDSVRLKIEFLKKEAVSYPIVYPKLDNIKKIIAKNPTPFKPVSFSTQNLFLSS